MVNRLTIHPINRKWVGIRVDTKVDFSISRNPKFYAKLKCISRNFVPMFCGISRNLV
jgi:hypothetical protein